MRVAAVIVAGGEGTRMGSRLNKVFVEVDERSILEHALGRFETRTLVDQVVVVGRRADLSQYDSLRTRFRTVTAVAPGGDQRQCSKFAGLRSQAARIDAGEVDPV